MIALSALLTSFTLGGSISTEVTVKPSISAKKKAKPYLLKKCIVSDEDLGSMGDPIIFVYKGQEIKVCCKPCIKKFKKNPKKYIKLLTEKTKKKSK